MAKKAAKATTAAVEEIPSHKLAVSMSKSGPFLSEMTAYGPLAVDKLAIGIQIDFAGTQVVSSYVMLRQEGVPQIHVWQGDVPPTIESRVDSINGHTFEVAVMCEAAELHKYLAKHAQIGPDTLKSILLAALTQWNDTQDQVDESGLPDDGEYHEVGELVPEDYEPPFQEEPAAKPAKEKKGKTAKNKGGFYDVPQETAEILKVGEFDPADQPPEPADEDTLDEEDELEDDETEFEEESEDELEEVYEYADGEETEFEEDPDSESDDDLEDADPDTGDSEEFDEDEESEDDEDDLEMTIKLLSQAKTMEQLMEYGTQLGLPTSQLKKRTTVTDLKKFLIKYVSEQ
jgi:hypothetical protein